MPLVGGISFCDFVKCSDVTLKSFKLCTLYSATFEEGAVGFDAQVVPIFFCLLEKGGRRAKLGTLSGRGKAVVRTYVLTSVTSVEALGSVARLAEGFPSEIGEQSAVLNG